MIRHFEERFAGYECAGVSNGVVTLHAMKAAGPRIIGLQMGNGVNLMAEVPPAGESPQAFIPRGGQRLWHGPEDPVRTYQPDNLPVAIELTDSGLTLTQETEAKTGIQKSMGVALADGKGEVTVRYGLRNHNLWPVSLTAWPVAQVRMGGFAILPLSTMDTGLLPNRRLVFWPYADIRSENIVLGNRYVFVRARYQGSEKTKLGWLNDRGWMGYYLERTLLVKRAVYVPGGRYVDLGCSMACYADRRFLEMETMSPLTVVEPGGQLVFEENWSVFSNINLTMREDSVEEVIKDLKIE